jgi:hypothetical protein
MTDIEYSRFKTLLPEGSICIKEYQPWGKCPTFKTPCGNIYYYIDHAFTHSLDTIRDTWRPVAHEEREIYCKLFLN